MSTVGRTYGDITSKASYLGLSVNPNLRKKVFVKFKPLKKIAAMIEDWVSNPDLTNKELAKKHDMNYHHVMKYKSSWFYYRGENSEIITLKSKV